MTPYRETFVVDFADCDPARIVFYPRYFEWFDRCCERMFRAKGLPWTVMWPERGLRGLPIVDAQASFKGPSRFGDEITIEAWVDEWRGKLFLCKYRVINGGETTVEGHELRVWARADPDSPQGMKAEPVPQDIIDQMES